MKIGPIASAVFITRKIVAMNEAKIAERMRRMRSSIVKPFQFIENDSAHERGGSGECDYPHLTCPTR